MKKPGISDPYTWNFLRAHRDIMRPKAAAVSCRKRIDLSFYAHRYIFLQNDCCDLTPPVRLIHIKILHLRHADALGSQSTRKKIWISIMITNQIHAIKNYCVLALRDLTPCAMRYLHATRLLRSHAGSPFGSRKEIYSYDAPNIDDL